MRTQIVFAATTLMLLVAAPLPQANSQSTNSPHADRTPRIMLGYYPSWSGATLPIKKIPFDRLTHICHAFLPIDDSGRPVVTAEIPSKILTRTAHKKNVLVLLSVGGAGTSDQFAQLVDQVQGRDDFVERLVKLVIEYEYDGVDLDWEYPKDAKQSAGFADLVRDLRKRLDAAGKRVEKRLLLTAAISANQFGGRFVPVEKTAKQFDFFNIMAYDMAGPWGTHIAHHSPLVADKRDPAKKWRSVTLSLDYWHRKRHLAKHQLVVGIPFYGRGFVGSTAYSKQDKKRPNPVNAIAYRRIVGLEKGGWRALSDTKIGSAWIRSPDRMSIVGYDDCDSVAKKTRWAAKCGYRGVFFWSLEQDTLEDGTHPLLEVSSKAWPVKTNRDQ